MQDGPEAVWSIPYVSVAFFPSLKQNFIAYLSSKVSWRPDCIFEIHQPWQSGFSRVYSNSCCSYSFEPEIIKLGQSPLKMYSNNIVNFQESTTILNTCTKKSGNLLNSPRIYRQNLALNNQQGLICHKTQATSQPRSIPSVVSLLPFFILNMIVPLPILRGLFQMRQLQFVSSSPSCSLIF